MTAFFLNLSCSTTTPTASNNFQNPVQTIAAINFTFTFTPVNTPTNTPTITPTFTPTSTFTPYVASTWTGFSSPNDVAVDGNGNFYVADTGNNKVERYTSSGSLDLSWGYGGKGKGSIAYNAPLGLAVNAAGTTLYVVGTAGQVGQFGPGGNLLNNNFASAVTLVNPQDVAVDTSGNVYISDMSNLRVVELDYSGSSVGAFSTGVSIYGIAVCGSSSVSVFVAAADNTVREYVSSSLVATIPGFMNPKGLAVDSAGNLYVADSGNKQIEEFSANNYNQVPLPFNGGVNVLSNPVGVAVDGTGNIYVADSGNGTVFKFAP